MPRWLVSYVLDPLERAANTFVQQLVIVLLAGGSGDLLLNQRWATAADTAGFAAIISLLASIATFAVPRQSPPVDLALRVIRTFLSSVVGTLAASTATHSVVHADWKGAVAVAIPVAFTALLKGLSAMANAKTLGPSLLPLSWAST